LPLKIDQSLFQSNLALQARLCPDSMCGLSTTKGKK
jgi:hypothetical protein